MTPKKIKLFYFFIFFILTPKVLIILLLYMTFKLLFKRVDVNQDGPSLIIEPPQIMKNVPQITSIFYILLKNSFGVKYILKCLWGLEACI